jgi:hypothetical protein
MVMGSGDELANTFTVSVKRGGEMVDLAGCTVTGYLIMPNDETLRITGSVKDGKASVTVPKSGYVYDGAFQLAIKIVVDGKENTVAIFTGQNARTTSENISDGEKVIYGVKDILNMIGSMEQAEADAKSATTAATNAAASANSAAQSANTIAQTVENKLDAGDFKGEKGDTGSTPNITFHVATGEPGTQVQITQSGTPENPVVDLTIPRGDTGAVDGVDYYEGNPAALGTASPGVSNGLARGDHVHPMPTAEQVGARPDNWMPTASQIEGLAAVATSGSYDDLTDTPDIPAEYELPVASAETLGGVKIGNGLTIDADGTVSSAGGTGGGFEMVLLWNNASRESDFAAQKIALDLSSYQTVCIVFDYSAKSYIQGVAFDTVKESSTAQRTCLSMALTNSVARYVTTTTTGCDFGSGMIVMPYGTVVEQSGRAVPLFIYGIR